MRTLLIANRGEIARRILCTARRMGLRCVAVYSDADRDALHVREADAALRIGGPAPADSYLNIAAIVEAARASGAEAVHPGYGFLAENADFAQAVLDAGLVFVGPPPAAIRAMGHKSGAKALMQAAAVPCIPGSNEATGEAAARIGYPLMIKAAAGGGGRGMRLVHDASEFDQALRSARSEAQHAFGSAEVLLEKALVEPRHVEVQVFADALGNVVHLGERDCSVQRRHQKLIEESPSPAVDTALRARMGAVAIAAARAIDYRGAGTVEFLLDSSGAFYFMEMNTRLQVEHAVTEALCDVDLVEWQIRIACGAPLPLAQPELDARLARGGHAIEVRLCAEDPARGFLPQGGAVALWRAPSGVRCDHALETGGTIPPYYDSMVAKLVAHGASRDAALAQLIAAADATVLLGVPTNRGFLAACLRHPEFARGAATTSFVARHMQQESPAPDDALLACAAAAAVRPRGAPRFPPELAGWSNTARHPRIVRLLLDGAPHRVELRGTALPADLAEHDGVTYFVFAGREHRVVDASHAPSASASGAAHSGRIVSPINGRVVAVEVARDQRVGKGQTIAVLEAMKMEHRIASPIDGRVIELGAQVGQQVAPGEILARVDPSP